MTGRLGLIIRWSDTRDGLQYQVRTVGWSTIAFWNRDGFWVARLPGDRSIDEYTDEEIQALLDAARAPLAESS